MKIEFKYPSRYKERLDLKFLKTFNPSSTLDGERWIFVANDMDDFRTSLPAQTDGSKMVMKVCTCVSQFSHRPQINDSRSVNNQFRSRILCDQM